MSLLDQLLKTRRIPIRRTLPFTQRAIQIGGLVATKPRRDFQTSIANTLKLRSKQITSNSVLPLAITVGSDRRLFHPSKHRVAFDTSGRQVTPKSYLIPMKDSPNEWVETTTGEIIWKPRIHYARNMPGKTTRMRPTVLFEDPLKTWICLKRKMRREIMHAIGKTGKVGQAPARRNAFSGVKCW